MAPFPIPRPPIMRLRNILQLFRRPLDRQLDAAMTVEARSKSLVYKDFREFTAPARQQRGGSLRIASPRNDRLSRTGIIPVMGGNVP